jgi:hypothetical protein
MTPIQIGAILGIDPGVRGAACIIVPHPSRFEAVFADYGEDGSDIEAVIREFADRIALAWVEGNFGGWGRSGKRNGVRVNTAGMMSVSDQSGRWYGFCRALKIPVEQVSPRTWRARYKFIFADDAKERTMRALKRHTSPQIYRACFGPKGGYLDGRGDSCGIALAARETFLARQKTGGP